MKNLYFWIIQIDAPSWKLWPNNFFGHNSVIFFEEIFMHNSDPIKTGQKKMIEL